MTSPISGGKGSSGSRAFDMGELCNQLLRFVPITQSLGQSFNPKEKKEVTQKIRAVIEQVLAIHEANQGAKKSKASGDRETFGKVYGLVNQAAKMGLIEGEVLNAVAIVAEMAKITPERLAFTLSTKSGDIEICNSDLLCKKSPFFAEMFKSGSSEAARGRSEVFREFPKETVESLLEYLQASKMNDETGFLEVPLSEFEHFIESQALFAKMDRPISGFQESVVIRGLYELDEFIRKCNELRRLGTPIDKLKISSPNILPKEAQASLEAAGITNVDFVEMRYGPKVPEGTRVIGPEDWYKLMGPVGEIAPDPSLEGIDLVKHLEEKDPFNPGKKRKETQTLLYIPKSVGRVPMTLVNFLKLVQERYPETPLIAIAGLNTNVEKQFGNQRLSNGYWMLISNDVIPGSKRINRTKIFDLFRLDPSYNPPGVAEVTMFLIMKRLKTGETGFKPVGEFTTFSMCREEVIHMVSVGKSVASNGLALRRYDLNILVGSAPRLGLVIECSLYGRENGGVAASLKLGN